MEEAQKQLCVISLLVITILSLWHSWLAYGWLNMIWVDIKHGPLTSYVELRVAHALGMPRTFSPPPPLVSNPNMHSRHVRHACSLMHVGIAYLAVSFEADGGKNVSGKRPMRLTHQKGFYDFVWCYPDNFIKIWNITFLWYINDNCFAYFKRYRRSFWST